MTLDEYKLTALKQGFCITECNKYSRDTPGEVVTFILVEKWDVDNVKFDVKLEMSLPLYGTELHKTVIEQAVLAIEEHIAKRHVRDISTCDHITVPMNYGSACANCMKKVDGAFDGMNQLSLETVDFRRN